MLLTLLLMVAVGAFFYLLYPYHLHYYEQMQMFQFTADYFRETVMLPGGLADYAGRFLTQFFHIAWAGASIMALLYGLVFLASCLVVRQGLLPENRVFWLPLLLLPIRYLWVNACDENAMPALYVAFILSLLSAWAMRKVEAKLLRRLASVVLYVLLYVAVGPLAALFVVLMLLHECRQSDGMRWVWALVLLVVALATPAAAHQCVNWPLENLYLGLRYFRFPTIQLAYIWVAAGILALIDLASHLAQSRLSFMLRDNKWLVAVCNTSLGALLIGLGVSTAYRPNNEVAMKYNAMVLDARWDDILHEASVRTPKHPDCVQCINLAMAMTGRMGDLLFRCPQPGSDVLLPKFTINFARPLTAGIIYYNIGWANTAQRFVFEANESIPDFEKSARCYQLLAQTHIVRGEKALARKYLKKLQHTLFYDDWAEEQLRLLADPDPKTLGHHPGYGPMMNGAVRDDYFFGSDVLAMLGNYCTTTPHNRVATQYLLSLALVQRKLETFVACYGLSQYLESEDRVPEYWQQALALDWWLKHGSWQGMTYRVEERVCQALQQFMADREAGLPESVMMQKYVFTYWYYHFAGEEETVGEEQATRAPN